MGFNTGMAGSRKSVHYAQESMLEEQQESEVEKIALKVITVIHFNEETGFFVFEGEPTSKQPLRVTINGIPYFNKRFTVQGVSPSFGEHKRIGQVIDCVGKWKTHNKYGIQFESVYINEQLPESPEALLNYLSSKRIKGIGPAIAKNIVNKWGMGAFDIFDNHPEQLLEISGITEEKMHTISKSWKEKRMVYEIVSYLGQYGIGESSAIKVYKEFESIKEKNKDFNIIEKITENPYILVDIDGIGFKTADKVAVSMGFPLDHPLRLKAALNYELQEKTNKEGNTAIPVSQWINDAAKDLRMESSEIQSICQELVNTYKVYLRELPILSVEYRGMNREPHIVETRQLCVSPFKSVEAEKHIAKNIKRLFNTAPQISDKIRSLFEREIASERRQMDESQRKAALLVLNNPVVVLTGGPGTGKTTTLKNIVSLAIEAGLSVTLASPTGKAAKRMEEAIGLEAKTIHRTLGAQGKTFAHHDKNKLNGDFFIIDENSMMDTALMNAWLKAIPDGAKVLFVGDADQLPSVGAGDVMRDFINSGTIPVARLTEVHRTAKGSEIAINAQLVNKGQMPKVGGNVWTDDYAFIETDGEIEIQEKMLEVVEGLIEKGTNTNDIQILCPQKNKEIGTETMNSYLRWLLNPKAPAPEDVMEMPHFFDGEKVMQTSNDYELEVFNGDMGIVSDILPDESFIFNTEDGRKIEMNKSNYSNLEYGYAISIHKSQGSEKPIVIIPVSSVHSYTLNRNLIYTGMTRAKQKLILIGEKKAMFHAVKKLSQKLRITGLVDELRNELPQI